MDQFIALVLIVAIWAGLMAGYIAWERIRDKRKRNRFERQLRRWQT